MKKPINEIAKMQRIAGIITESEYQEALSNKESDLQELTPDQMAGIAGAATGVAGGLAAALAAVKQEYNKVVKGNPEMSATEAAKQALMNAGRSLKAQFGGLSEDEAPEGTYYIKVSIRDAKRALEIIHDNPAYRKAVEMDGSDAYYLTNPELAYDLQMDFGTQNIEVVDTNVDMDEAKQALMNAGRSLKAQFGGLSEDENQSSSLDVTNEADVLQFLADNGIDDDYFESMGGQEIENGSDEWMNVLSALTGKDAYEDEFDTNDDQKIRNFMTTIGRLGIEFI
jgi:hypothetical protein